MSVLIWLLIVLHSAAGLVSLVVGAAVANLTLIYTGVVGMTLVVILAKLFL